MHLIRVKLIRVLAFEWGVKGLDGDHVGFNVACGLKDRAQAASFVAVVQISHHDGHLGTHGNVIEAGFPIVCFAAAAFGRHGELQRAGSGLDGCHRRSDQVVGFFPVNGQASQPHHQTSKRGLEQVIFSHPVEIEPQHKSDHQGVGQVPVAGVGRRNENAFLRARRQAAFHFPASEFQNSDGKRAQDGVDDGGGKDGAVHVSELGNSVPTWA